MPVASLVPTWLQEFEKEAFYQEDSMPIREIEALTGDSSDAQTKAAISSCIATEVNAGRDQQQAIAMCHELARGQGAPVAQVPEGGE